MKFEGVKEEDVVFLRKKYGSNQISQVKKNSFWKLLLESLGDPIIKILLVALAIKIVFLFRDFDFYETLGIFIAVFLATFISTISEYGSEAAFQRLQEEASQMFVKVIRSGKKKEIRLDEVVVGDVIYLQTGDKIPADGSMIEGSIQVDESALNGESKEVVKESSLHSEIKEENKVYRGTVVMSGMGKMVTLKVGDATFYGNLAREVQEPKVESPLRIRLRGLARIISRIGYIGAFLVFFSYLFSVIVLQNHFVLADILSTIRDVPFMIDTLIYALTLCVTIIVVAVPEGLPMMITLVLSSNMKRMLKSNVLVRKMTGIETTGNINYLLTDKTGTLTKGKLEVTGIYDHSLRCFKNEGMLQNVSAYYEIVKQAMTWNNDAMWSSSHEILGGNSTDRAFLSFFTANVDACQVLHRVCFDSKKKYSAVTVMEHTKKRTYYKGAAEQLLPYCTSYLNESGEKRVLFDQRKMEEFIRKLTQAGSRVLILCYSDEDEDLKEDAKLVFVSFVSVRDELRLEAKKGISLIQNAGIEVIMITGDHPDTARVIAKESGLLKNASDLILTSQELSHYTDEEIEKFIPRLRVVARALPHDKSRLVKILQNMDQVVGMTGDGVNDAPALKRADVGFAMGSGTEVSKEASDIVILDDNILSISQAILYGRTIFKSIRKFIIYQLTCNMCALFLSIVGPFIGVNTPITIIQMLWINMIMDTFAGLAFSFEPALLETMMEKPKKKNEPIMNFYMYSQVIITGLYSAFLCIFFLKAPIIREVIRPSVGEKYLMTAYFALFIFIGVCNAFNARTYRLNLFAHLKKNRVFLGMILFIFSVQCYLLYYGGDLFRTYGLTASEFFIVLLLSFTVIPFDFLRKYIMKKKGFALGV